MYFDALKILEKHLPKNHINIIRLYSNLAACLHASSDLFANKSSQLMFTKLMRAVHHQVDSRMIEIRKENATKKKSFRKVLESALEPLLWYTPTRLTEINDCVSSRHGDWTWVHMFPNFPLHPTDQEIEFTNMVQVTDETSNK